MLPDVPEGDKSVKQLLIPLQCRSQALDERGEGFPTIVLYDTAQLLAIQTIVSNQPQSCHAGDIRRCLSRGAKGLLTQDGLCLPP